MQNIAAVGIDNRLALNMNASRQLRISSPSANQLLAELGITGGGGGSVGMTACRQGQNWQDVEKSEFQKDVL